MIVWLNEAAGEGRALIRLAITEMRTSQANEGDDRPLDPAVATDGLAPLPSIVVFGVVAF